MLPWSDMWRAALVMGVPPQEFWHLSVREWRWLIAPNESRLTAERLKELMKEHPDG